MKEETTIKKLGKRPEMYCIMTSEDDIAVHSTIISGEHLRFIKKEMSEDVKRLKKYIELSDNIKNWKIVNKENWELKKKIIELERQVNLGNKE